MSLLPIIATLLKQIPGINKIIHPILNIFSQIPTLFFTSLQTLTKDIKQTPHYIYVLLIVEFIFIISYLVIPLIVNSLYLLNPGDKDYNYFLSLRLKAAKNSVKRQKKIVKELKAGIAIKWRTVPTMNDNDLRVKLFDLGYTEDNVDTTIQYIRKYQDEVNKEVKELHTLENHYKLIKKEEKAEKSYASTILLRKPVYTDKMQTVGSYENLKKGNDYNYQYSISSWIFLHEQPPNHSWKYNKFTSLLNYGNKPNILYNMKTRVLRVQMGNGVGSNTIIYESHHFPLQKWNNIVINYDKGTLDIFINKELVASQKNMAPYMTHRNITVGEEKGLSGGICNVVYYSGNLSKSRIDYFYNFLKNRNPPII